MQLKMALLAALIGVTLLSISIVGGEVFIDDTSITKESITDFSYFPMPTLPSAKVLDNTVFVGSGQGSEYETILTGGHNLIAVKKDPFYGEVTLFYATPAVQQIITNNDSIQDIVSKGAIVFDYEKIHNLQSRYSDKKPLFTTNNSNPVYADLGLNGRYLVIIYDEDTKLSVYGNATVDLKALVKSMDL